MAYYLPASTPFNSEWTTRITPAIERLLSSGFCGDPNHRPGGSLVGVCRAVDDAAFADDPFSAKVPSMVV